MVLQSNVLELTVTVEVGVSSMQEHSVFAILDSSAASLESNVSRGSSDEIELVFVLLVLVLVLVDVGDDLVEVPFVEEILFVEEDFVEEDFVDVADVLVNSCL